jgi:hypothetical protein
VESGHSSASGAKIFHRTRLREESDFVEQFQQIHPTGKSLESPSSPPVENILIFRNSKSVYIHRIPSHSEGALRNVNNAGRGCGGRGWCF